MGDSMGGVKEAISEERRAYEAGAERPTAAYAVTMLAYAGGVGALALAGRLSRRPLPKVTPWDLLLVSVSTHKLSRLIAKDPVTSPLRAPFTRFEGAAGPAELHEEVRGHGARHALGELVTCPFCLAQWVATAHVAGLVLAPGFTRLAAAAMTAVGVSDWLQLGYARLQQSAEGGGDEN
jgi:hypothetical protein